MDKFLSSMEDKGDRARTALSSDHSHTQKFTRRRKKKHQHRNVTSGAAGTIMKYNSRNEKVEESQSELTYCEWDSEGLSANMEFVSDSETMAIRRQIATKSTDGARCHHGYQRGRHEFVFEFTGKWGSHCAVGLCKRDSILYRPGYVHLLGQDACSWAFDIPSGQLFHRGHVVGAVGSMKNSDIKPRVGMEVDFEAGRLLFRISVGRLFRTCTYVSEELCQPPQPLYPVISMVYGLAQCTVQRLISRADNALKKTEKVELKDHQETSPLNWMNLVFNGDKNTGLDNQIVEDDLSSSDATELLMTETMDDRRQFNELVVEMGDWNARSESYGGKELMAVSELSEKNRLMVESFHGWDNICRGGLLFPHPGAPSICIPAPRLSGSVQAIRSKQGFVSGRHRWRIRQLKFYSKNTAAEANDIFVGVVSSEHAVFNYGYSLSNVGPFAWCYQPMTKSFWHGSSSQKLTDCVDEDSTYSGNDLELELDLDLQTLTYFSRGKALATVRHVHGKQLFPFVIFHKENNQPVQILYCKGPTDYLDKVLETVAEPEKMVSVFNYQPQLLRSSSIYLTDFGEQSRMNGFHWGQVSPGVKKNPQNVAQMSSSFMKPVILAAECSLSGNIHKVQWTVEAENQANLILGLVGEEFDVDSFAQEILRDDGSARFLGDTTLSWGWDLSSRKLFHAGHPIATYPIFEGFDCQEFNIYRMTVAYVSMNCSSVSFEIVRKKSSDQTIDLGMAFINVPTNVYPAVMIRPPKRKNVNSKTTTVTMEYYSGSWNPDGKRPLSRFCSIL